MVLVGRGRSLKDHWGYLGLEFMRFGFRTLFFRVKNDRGFQLFRVGMVGWVVVSFPLNGFFEWNKENEAEIY